MSPARQSSRRQFSGLHFLFSSQRDIEGAPHPSAWLSFGNCGTEGFALSLSQIQEFSKTDLYTPPQPEKASQVALVIKNLSANAEM